MRPTIRKKGDIDPDGVRIIIPWSLIEIGSSVFVPCLNLARGRKQLMAAAEGQQMRIVIMTWIEERHLGLRFWRIA